MSVSDLKYFSICLVTTTDVNLVLINIRSIPLSPFHGYHTSVCLRLGDVLMH